MLLEQANGSQAVHRVAGKAGNGFRNNQVDLPGQRVGNHVIETLSVFGAGSGDALVSVNLYEMPVRLGADVICVVADLRLIADLLLVAVGGNAGIGRHAALALFCNGRGCETVERSRENGNSWACSVIFTHVHISFWRGRRPALAYRLSSCRGENDPAIQLPAPAHIGKYRAGCWGRSHGCAQRRLQRLPHQIPQVPRHWQSFAAEYFQKFACWRNTFSPSYCR